MLCAGRFPASSLATWPANVPSTVTHPAAPPPPFPAAAAAAALPALRVGDGMSRGCCHLAWGLLAFIVLIIAIWGRSVRSSHICHAFKQQFCEINNYVQPKNKMFTERRRRQRQGFWVGGESDDDDEIMDSEGEDVFSSWCGLFSAIPILILWSLPVKFNLHKGFILCSVLLTSSRLIHDLFWRND